MSKFILVFLIGFSASVARASSFTCRLNHEAGLTEVVLQTNSGQSTLHLNIVGLQPIKIVNVSEVALSSQQNSDLLKCNKRREMEACIHKIFGNMDEFERMAPISLILLAQRTTNHLSFNPAHVAKIKIYNSEPNPMIGGMSLAFFYDKQGLDLGQSFVFTQVSECLK